MKKNLYVHYKDILATRQQKEVYGDLVSPDADVILTGIQDHFSFENKLFNRSSERIEVVEYFGLGFETSYIEPPNSISDHITFEAQPAVYENLSTFSEIQKFDIELQFDKSLESIKVVELVSREFITEREDITSVEDLVALQPAKFFEETIGNTESYFFNIFPGINEDLQTTESYLFNIFPDINEYLQTVEQLSYSFDTSQTEEIFTVDLLQFSRGRSTEESFDFTEVLNYVVNQSISDVSLAVETVLKDCSASFFDSASTAEVKNVFLTNYLLTPTTYFSEEYIGTRISI